MFKSEGTIYNCGVGVKTQVQVPGPCLHREKWVEMFMSGVALLKVSFCLPLPLFLCICIRKVKKKKKATMSGGMWCRHLSPCDNLDGRTKQNKVSTEVHLE